MSVMEILVPQPDFEAILRGDQTFVVHQESVEDGIRRCDPGDHLLIRPEPTDSIEVVESILTKVTFVKRDGPLPTTWAIVCFRPFLTLDSVYAISRAKLDYKHRAQTAELEAQSEESVAYLEDTRPEERSIRLQEAQKHRKEAAAMQKCFYALGQLEDMLSRSARQST